MFLVDSHCHLDLLNLMVGQDSIEQVIARAKEKGVQHILNVCVSLAAFPSVLKTAETYPLVSASVGLHPNEQTEEIDAGRLIAMAQHDKIVAIGETGLDYYRSAGEVEWQRIRFRAHIEAAKKTRKPLIVHTRAAKDDTIRIMHEEAADQVGGVMHCFTEDWSVAKKALDLNFYISLSGIVTFKNATTIQEVAKKMPIDRLLIETDSPYLAPEPHRGHPNEPAYVRHTAEFIAAMRQMDIEAFAEQTSQNFFNLFKGAERAYV